MRSHAHPVAYFWVVACILLQSGAVACAKQASMAHGSVLANVINPWYALSLSLLVCQAGAWMLALRRLALSVAYPLTSVTFALNILVAHWLFHERIAAVQVGGIAIIVVGVVVLSTGSGGSP